MKVNTPAPNFTLPAVTGEPITLSEVVKHNQALLIFLRHLG
jgi:peroxiredoxin